MLGLFYLLQGNLFILLLNINCKLHGFTLTMNRRSINPLHDIQRRRELLLLLQDQNKSVETVLQNTRSMHAHELNSSRSINGEYSTLFPLL